MRFYLLDRFGIAAPSTLAFELFQHIRETIREACPEGRAGKEDPRDPTKENPRIPHGMGVIRMMAAQDTMETVDVAVVAEEVTAEVPVQPCRERHQRLVHAKI